MVGGFSKLLKHFINNLDVNKIITFADLTYSYGEVYEKSGFIKDTSYTDKPGYFYFYEGRRYHRSSFMKSKIADRFNVDVSNKTETELILELGIFKNL